jgi:polyisoprenoid-binding protein YceI
MTTFALDPAHSSVDFTVRHMVFSKVRGSFTSFSVTLEIDDATNLPTSISAKIDAASINTQNTDRDNHLKSADFLDAANYPSLDFISSKVSGIPDDFTVEGMLTIHGVTKPVTLKGTVDGRGKDPWGNDRIAFSATASLNRKEFGLGWNQSLETGGVLVGEQIEISMSVQAVKAQETAAV